MTVTFEVDDRVKVGALTGTVRWVSHVDDDPAVDVHFDHHDTTTEYVPIELVEKIAKRLKVGDVIEGAAAHDALPVGAVVQRPGGSHIIRTARGFADAEHHRLYTAGDLVWPRTIVYLPA